VEKDGAARYTIVPEAGTALAYLTEGVRRLRTAVELDGSRGTYHLTFAYLLDVGRHLASYVDTGDLLAPHGVELDPKLVGDITLAVHELAEEEKAAASLQLLTERLDEGIMVISRLRIRPDRRSQATVQALLERYWVKRCVEEYKRAFDLGLEGDLTLATHRMHAGLESYEAGTALLRLRAEVPGPFPLDDEAIAAIKAGLAKIDSIEARTFVSPIVLPAMPGEGIDELCDPGTRVCFDLDGDGVVENCSWVRPTTGILVWDPDRSGRVESGRDMFGNATWWLLFSDGYRALDALDDDRDGWLTGAELDHLSVWYDLDSDGHAGPGEVIPIERTEIVGLATHWDAHEGTALRATRGMLLRGGTVLPSYDWYADCSR
jgi:hypothetical protein